MTKTTFLKELERFLKPLAPEERQDILLDYEEHFQSGMQAGKSEDEVADDLGNPRIIAKELLAEYHITKAEEDRSVRNIGRAAIATLSLGFFNLVFALGPFLGLVGLLVGLYAATLAFLISPIIIIVFHSWSGGFSVVVENIFNMMMTGGLGVLLAVGMVYVSKGFYWLVLKYLNFNVKIIRGEKA